MNKRLFALHVKQKLEREHGEMLLYRTVMANRLGLTAGYQMMPFLFCGAHEARSAAGGTLKTLLVRDAPSLAVSKATLDGTLSSLVQREVSLPTAGRWERDVP